MVTIRRDAAKGAVAGRLTALFVLAFLAAVTACGSGASGAAGHRPVPARNGPIDDPKCQALADALSGAEPAGALARASYRFKDAEDGAAVSSELNSFPTDAAAQAYLDRFAQAIHECTAFTETDADAAADTTTDVTLETSALPGIGDSSASVDLLLTRRDVTSQLDVLVTRVGATLVTVTAGGRAAADVTVTSAVADQAVAKLRNPLTASVPTATATAGFRPDHRHPHRHRHGNPWFGF